MSGAPWRARPRCSTRARSARRPTCSPGPAPSRWCGGAPDVLAELGIEPLVLEAKEGLAMTNGTSFMSGFATLAVHDARELAFVADLCTSMASQALMGNHGHFNAFLFEAKPHPGIIESAAN